MGGGEDWTNERRALKGVERRGRPVDGSSEHDGKGRENGEEKGRREKGGGVKVGGATRDSERAKGPRRSSVVKQGGTRCLVAQRDHNASMTPQTRIADPSEKLRSWSAVIDLCCSCCRDEKNIGPGTRSRATVFLRDYRPFELPQPSSSSPCLPLLSLLFLRFRCSPDLSSRLRPGRSFE